MPVKTNRFGNNSRYQIVSVFVMITERRQKRTRRNKINAITIIVLLRNAIAIEALSEGKLILLPIFESAVYPEYRVRDPDGILLGF
jgi:hypothetical protein